MPPLRLALLVCVLSLVVGAAHAQGLHRATLVLDGIHRLERVEGHLLQLGGRTSIGPDSRIEGAVVLVGEALDVEGTIAGDVFHLSGTLTLADGARIEGRLVAAGGELEAASGATVVGGIERDLQAAAELVRPTPTAAQRAARLVVQALALALLAYVLGRTTPGAIDRTGTAIAEHPLVALAMGTLAGTVGLVLMIAMVFTVILIPLALLGGVVYAAAVAFGWVAVGHRLARRWPGPTTPARTALATAAFVLALHGVTLVPWVGAPLGLAAGVAALGGVVLTGFGRRRFVPDAIPNDRIPSDPITPDG